MNDGPGLALLAPGGLFEAVVLPIWLIVKGFTAPPSTRVLEAPARSAPSPSPPSAPVDPAVLEDLVPACPDRISAGANGPTGQPRGAAMLATMSNYSGRP